MGGDWSKNNEYYNQERFLLAQWKRYRCCGSFDTGGTFLTLAGIFLFGSVFGSILVVLSATMGATLLYFAVKTSLGDWLAQKATGWMSRMREGFQENAFSYLLFLRLVPLFPFWVINIVPASQSHTNYQQNKPKLIS
ncbi:MULTISPECIES: TVP38/TMEM64 family protein [unclassified Legionella]|uniref:TVP38/TMEM64 family protein n=1 Tax=unclassified Legionella TaxID=2622702 RepID=UPI001F5F653A|nr:MULTISPECIES: VTT domain-containing protein [unclassified Legionella]MDI9817826.1 VTT domain-containing protein [Legionella sp. PL877]